MILSHVKISLTKPLQVPFVTRVTMRLFEND
jgi:hypothetical protein